MGINEWYMGLCSMLLKRRRTAHAERTAARARLVALGGAKLANKGVKSYSTLKHALNFAMDDPQFQSLTRQRALWMEFGVLTGLSTNITADYLGMMHGVPADVVVNGFDTFTGLPESWSDGKGGVRFPKGSFSWAARGRGKLPPVRARVRLHVGLFNETLAPFLQRHDAAAGIRSPLAFVNVDCDLYAGAIQALEGLGPRMCPGTRIHFHELLHDRVHTARKLLQHRPPMEFIPSDEARALYKWLRAQPGAALEMMDVVSTGNAEAAVFIVRDFPGGACGGTPRLLSHLPLESSTSALQSGHDSSNDVGATGEGRPNSLSRGARGMPPAIAASVSLPLVVALAITFARKSSASVPANGN